MDLQHPVPATCSMPRGFDSCLKSVGCDDALDCMPSFFDGEDGKYRCIRPCTKTSDCPNPEMKCWRSDSRYRAFACPGYVVDHVKALKHGGRDDPSNMQWQTAEEAKAKDKWE